MRTTTTSSTGNRPGTSAAGILCGTDFSSTAQRAADVAAAWAQCLNAPLELLHASVIPAYPPLLKNLKAEAARLRQQGAEVRETLVSGDADTELVQRATPGNCRLVVVSSLGKRAPERWLLGSVSERTAARATVPTLVVRDAAPFEAWIRGRRPLKVFVAFNFTATAEAAAQWVKDLLAIGPCDVVVGYVDWPPEQRTRLGGSGALPLVGNTPDVQAVLERDLTSRVAELMGTRKFRTRVEANWGRPDARLADLATEEGADLLVVGAHQYRGFERLWHSSVSRGLLHSAPMSVAVVPHASGQPRTAHLAPPMRRVLATTDFSDLANQAIPHAYGLLRDGGGTVCLVHVLEPLNRPADGDPQRRSHRGSHAGRARLIRECTGRLRALIPPEAALLGIQTEVEVVEHREVAEAIIQQAERFGADVLCLGTHGRSGWSTALVGSVAQKVMSHSTRPLLVVRPPAR